MEHWNYSPGLIPPFEPYYKRRYVVGFDPYSKELADEITSEGQKNLRDIADVVQANSLDEAKDAIKRIQSKGRLDRSKNSPHTQGIAMDLSLYHTPEYWRNAANYFARPIQSDRIIATAMLFKAMQLEKSNKREQPSNIHVIKFPELLEELLNYKPKNTTMKKFRNRFAVKGDIINLLRFERALLNLGYSAVGKSLIDWRSQSGQVAEFITSGVHFIASNTGQFIAAANNGSSTITFNIDTDFDAAVEYASQLVPLFYTHDGVAIYDTNTKMYGIRRLNDSEVYLRTDPNIYRNHRIVSINYSNQKSDAFLWFSSVEKAKEHINKTVPLFITKDGVAKFLGDTVWYIRPNWVYHFWKSGIKESYANTPEYIYFDKEENLIEYIKENRPVFHFSKKEFEKIASDLSGGVATISDIDYPKDFVKRD